MSGIKASIVVRNEFSIATPGAGKGGSRGGTPGKYVLGYMARSSAVESIAPVARTNVDTFITKYMARNDAVESVVAAHGRGEVGLGPTSTGGYTAVALAQRRAERSERRAAARALLGSYTKVRELPAREVAAELAGVAGDGGVAFGHSGVSLSHERLHADSAQIQGLFDSGKTVLKTVLSFTHEYLVSQGVVPEEVERGVDGEVKPGAYRGRLDQMKLRMAIQEGLGRLERSGRFDDLRYVGVLQVDTAHVHAHLAMIDAGDGVLASDGTQKGMLSDSDMVLLRRGVDMSLELTSHVKHLSSSVGHERRNVASWVKKWAYESLSTSVQAQFILACLPPDRRMWRASTNATGMAKPNRLVRALVEAQLAQEDSPMTTAMLGVREYAVARTDREGLSVAEHDRLVDDGRERIVTAAMNGVYGVLLGVADDELTVSTPMLSMMGTDFGELVEQVAATEASRTESERGRSVSAGQFALRLRSYTERCERHRRLRSEYLLALHTWEDSRDRGLVAPGSEVMVEHYRVEAEYHSKALAKYQYYLDLGSQVNGQWSTQWAQVENYGRRLAGLRALRTDKSLPKMSDSAAAEALGQEIYGQPGGAMLAATGGEGRAGRAIIDDRIVRAGARYSRMVDELIESWRATGASVRVRAGEPGLVAGDGEVVISTGDARLGGRELGEPGVAVVVAAAPEYAFDDVKGVDMHELGLDWATDQAVGPRCAARYEAMTTRRDEALAAATEWMILTDQDSLIDDELGQARADIERAQSTMHAVSVNLELPSLIAMAAARNAAVRAELVEMSEEAMAAAGMESAALAKIISAGDHELEAWLLEQLADRAPKPRGRTVRVDTGLGGAVHAGVEASVRAAVATPVD